MKVRCWAVAAATLALVTLSAGPAMAEARKPETGRFSFTETFVVQPGEGGSCPFPISAEEQKRGTFQVFFNDSGEPIRVMVHTVWFGTGTANGKSVSEHGALTETFNLVEGTSWEAGMIANRTPHGGVVIHDVGRLAFDANGNLTMMAGPHQGFTGDTAELCAALS